MFYRCQVALVEEEMMLLGTTDTIDIKQVMPDEDYTKLTVNNFVVVPTNNASGTRGPNYGWDSTSASGPPAYVGRTVSASVSISVSKSYNPSTGILTCSINTNAGKPPIAVYFYRKNT